MPTPAEPAAEPADAPPADSSPPRPPQRPVRWGRLAAVGAALLAAGLWFAPALVARSGLRHTLAGRLFPDLDADVTVGRADLSWLAPVALRDVTVAAPGAAVEAEPLLTVAAIRTDQPLHALLSAALFPGDEPAEFGMITLTNPRLRVAVRPGGSDLEDLLAPLLAGDPSDPAPGFAVAVEGGAVTLIDPAGRRLEGRELAGVMGRPAGATRPDRAEAAGWWGDGERSGTLAVAWAVAGGQPADRWTLRTDGLPLTAAAPLLTRFGDETDDPAGWALGGTLSGELAGTLDGAGWSAGGKLAGARLTARRADWPATDRLRLPAATLSGGLSGTGDGAAVRAERLRFASDLLHLSADGALPTAAPADPITLLDGDRTLSGRVDVAALAGQVPGLLGVAEGVTIESGTLTASAATAAADEAAAGESNARRLTAAIDLVDLRAVLPGGERVAPGGPISARLAATRDAAGAATVERFAARADGLTAVGRGSLDDLTADVAADLAALDRTFGRLLDLGGRWAGTADGVVHVRRAAADRFAVRAAGVGRDLRFAPSGGGIPVREEEVTVKVGADLARDGAGVWSAALAGVRAEAGGDVLTILPRESDELSVTLTGELATLIPRLQTFARLPIDSATGGVRASATLRPVRAAWAIGDGRAEFRRLAVDAPGLRVREAVATLDARGTFDPAAGRLDGAGEWIGGAVTLRAERFIFDPAATPAATADLTATGEAARLWAWFPAADAAGVRPEGRFAAEGTATASVGPAGFAGAGFAGTVELTDLAILTPPDPRSPPGTPWAVAWHEPAATLAGTVRYDAGAAHGTDGATDVLHLGPLAVTAGGASVTAGGTVADPAGAMFANLSGRLAVDWATLGPRLGARGATTGAGVTLTGTSDRPFAIRGPLGSPAALSGRAGVGWDELIGGGFSFGRGDLVATLDRGRARIDGVDWPLVPLADADARSGDPLARPVAVGRLRTTPTLDLTGREAVVRLPAGRILSSVRFTPEATRGWLGLVSPLAAGAVRADGAFDVDLDGTAAPLAELLAGDPRRAAAGGRLIIERADFTAGPVAGGLLAAVRGASALLRGSAGGDLEDVRVTFPTQSVPFRLSGGRAFHRNLLARSGSVEVTTAGSVGLDGTLDLRAEAPLGADLGGRTATVPIGGTLDAPRVDPSRLAAAAARGALDGAVQRERHRFEDRANREIGRGLERLFGRD